MNMYVENPKINEQEGIEEFLHKDDKGIFQTIGFAVVEILKGFLDSFQIVVIFLAIFVVVYLWAFSPHQVDGKSMFPNFQNKEFVIADKLFSKLGPYHRGDVVIFKYDDTKDFIKRVIGLPGDRVKLSGGKVYINGQLLHEPYLKDDVKTYPENMQFMGENDEKIVPEASYFVMGDNRGASTDSRAIGFINQDNHEIRGRVLLIAWPVPDFKTVSSPEYNLN